MNNTNGLSWEVCALSLAAATVLAGCSTTTRAPVEDRSTARGTQAAPQAVTSESSAFQGTAQHLAAERTAQESGRTHTVASGDTLYNIGVRYGVNPRELQSLNGISDPTMLQLGQVLKIPESAKKQVEVSGESALTASQATTVTGEVLILSESEKAEQTEQAPVHAATVETAVRPESAEQAAQRELAASKKARENASRGNLSIPWPIKGKVIADFAQTKSGIDIAGAIGDPIQCVLDGTVQYVGNSNYAQGYGQFLIVRHNIKLPGKSPVPLISVYGNTSRILVRVNESVRQGQTIAYVGDSDADSPKLRFELRQGRPFDPTPYLTR